MIILLFKSNYVKLAFLTLQAIKLCLALNWGSITLHEWMMSHVCMMSQECMMWETSNCVLPLKEGCITLHECLTSHECLMSQECMIKLCFTFEWESSLLWCWGPQCVPTSGCSFELLPLQPPSVKRFICQNLNLS